MKKLRTNYAHGKNIHTVSLTEEEKGLPDPVLISMADGVLMKDAIRVHEDKQHPGHFGGKVHKTDTDIAYITVYID